MPRHTPTSLTQLIKAHIKFWGVRGSFVTTENRIGGHTTCISIEYGDLILIIDSGTGSFDLGQYLKQKYLDENKELHVHVFHTHAHGDHLCGFSAFAPLWSNKTTVNMYSGRHSGLTSEDCMKKFVFTAPIFPMEFHQIPAKITHREFVAGERFTIPCNFGDVQVWVLPMKHPNGAFGFQFLIGGRALAITLDHTPGDPELDGNIVKLASDVDLQITEVQYTDEQFGTHLGSFGHISPQFTAEHAILSKPRLMYTTHHDLLATFEDLVDITTRIHRIARAAGHDMDVRFALQHDLRNDGIYL